MAIKAIFATNQDSITVTGLYQWDYGQQLEIDAEGLPEVIEVHFSCTNMTEAIVRTCVRDEDSGVYTVSIPDDCLEQSTPITAWIYDFSVTQGKTVKVITLPVVARTRPSAVREISADDGDQLATLITDLNNAVEGLKNGDIVVKKAESANTADTVTDFAGTVESANFATQAGMAQKDYQGNIIHSTYFKKADRPQILRKVTEVDFTNYAVRHGQKDSNLFMTALPEGKTLDNIAAIGFSFVYTDSLGVKTHYLEAHGIKSRSASDNSVLIACNVALRGLDSEQYATAMIEDGLFIAGAMQIELKSLADGSVYMRFGPSNIFTGLTPLLDVTITHVDDADWLANCKLQEVWLYVL